ncbi:hypothetical protein MKW98_019649 [Papaver atlanticum]|uniref:Uncharacterized protein n=1 Tax=Papaver atlanticum TaxID=357466 RepID=A0AAD4XA91_9MAGN|nr:hypothetical protein MKW98_019649 [Papaver atlanticum]
MGKISVCLNPCPTSQSQIPNLRLSSSSSSSISLIFFPSPNAANSLVAHQDGKLIGTEMGLLELKVCGVLSEASICSPHLISLDASFYGQLKDDCLFATKSVCPLIP